MKNINITINVFILKHLSSLHEKNIKNNFHSFAYARRITMTFKILILYFSAFFSIISIHTIFIIYCTKNIFYTTKTVYLMLKRLNYFDIKNYK